MWIYSYSVEKHSAAGRQPLKCEFVFHNAHVFQCMWWSLVWFSAGFFFFNHKIPTEKNPIFGTKVARKPLAASYPHSVLPEYSSPDQTYFSLNASCWVFSHVALHKMSLGVECWPSEHLRPPSKGETWLLHLVEPAVNTHFAVWRHAVARETVTSSPMWLYCGKLEEQIGVCARTWLLD